MGLLDYRMPTTPKGDSYLAYYRDYRGPQYVQPAYAPLVFDAPKSNGGFGGVPESNPQNSDSGGSNVGAGEGGGFAGTSSGPGISGHTATTTGLAALGAFGGPVGMALNGALSVAGMVNGQDKATNLAMAMNNLGFSDVAAAMADRGLTNDDVDTFGTLIGLGASGMDSDPGPSGTGNRGNAAEGIGGPDGPSGGDSDGRSGDASDAGVGGGGYRNGGLLGNQRSKQPEKAFHGLLDGPGTGTSDSIPAENVRTGEKARFSDGEYIIPADVVKKLGKKHFDDMIKKHHKQGGK